MLHYQMKKERMGEKEEQEKTLQMSLYTSDGAKYVVISCIVVSSLDDEYDTFGFARWTTLQEKGDDHPSAIYMTIILQLRSLQHSYVILNRFIIIYYIL